MATPSSMLAWRTPMDRGGWRATIHGVTQSQMRLSMHNPPRLMIQLEHESGKRAVSVRVLCVKHRNKLWLT